MSKGKIYGLCCGLENSSDEETIEAYVVTPMNEDDLADQWYDYYWSPSYKHVDVFIQKLKSKGISIIKLGETPAEFVKIEVV